MQQDCHEFLQALLDSLHEELNINRGPQRPSLSCHHNDSDAKKSEIAWKNWEQSNLSIISELFYGQLQNKVTCMVCKKDSITFDAPSILCSLSIPNKKNWGFGGSVSLNQCFEEYTKPEILSGDNAYLCPGCKTKREAKKQLTISRFPKILIVQLKRFTADGQKIFTYMDIPPTLDLHAHFSGLTTNPSYTRNQSGYQLVAVVRHHQRNGGFYKHYTAVSFLRTRTREGKREGWAEFDDDRCGFISAQEALRAGSEPYLLFYQQVQSNSQESNSK